jgi:hypothetical protein
MPQRELERKAKMTNLLTQPTLGQHMSHEALRPLVRKKLFGGYEVLLGPCICTVSIWLFQKGAILGRTRSGRLNVLAKLLPRTWANSGKETDVCGVLQEEAKKRLDEFGIEPDSFPTFWLKTEFSTLNRTNLELIMLSMKKVPLGKIVPKLDTWLMSGIGFGATYPELVQKMWKGTYETLINMDKWIESKEYGPAISKKQILYPLEEIEQNILLEVGRYISKYSPQLLEILGLQKT